MPAGVRQHNCVEKFLTSALSSESLRLGLKTDQISFTAQVRSWKEIIQCIVDLFIQDMFLFMQWNSHGGKLFFPCKHQPFLSSNVKSEGCLSDYRFWAEIGKRCSTSSSIRDPNMATQEANRSASPALPNPPATMCRATVETTRFGVWGNWVIRWSRTRASRACMNYCTEPSQCLPLL